MKRLIKINRMPAWILLLGIICFTSFAQDNPTPPETITTELAPGIYQIYYTNRVSFVAFSGEDGLLLVDAAYKRSGDQVLEELEKIETGTLRYIINTHWHGDHTGGNIPLGKDVDIIAHEHVKEMLSHDQVLMDRKRPPYPEHAWPNITFSDRLTIRFNGEDVQLIHLPGGHSGGDVIVWFPEGNVLVMGDLIFADNFPYVNIEHGGNAVNYVNNLFWVTENFPEDITIVPGHGRLYTMDDLKTWQSNLQQTINIIMEAKDRGLSKDQMKEQKILAEFAEYGKRWITEEMWIDVVLKEE